MRCDRLLFLCCLVSVAAPPALALEPAPEDSPGTLTLEFAWKVREEVRGIAPGHRIIDRRATLRCALVAGAVSPLSLLAGADAAQSAAIAELDAAPAAQPGVTADDGTAGMQALAARLSECRRSGRSEQACAMATLAAMQSDPAYREALDGIAARDARARDAAEAAVAAAGSRIQPWNVEGCRGTMTVADVSALDDPTTPGVDPPVPTAGTVRFDAGEHLLLIETDLARGSTSFLLNAPRAAGFLRGGVEPVDAVAMPVDQVRIGPLPGPLADGRHEFPVSGGSATVRWRFESGR